MFITQFILVDIILLLATTAFLLYKYFTRKFNFWKKLGVPYIQPTPFVGNIYDLLSSKTTLAELMARIYKSTSEPFLGLFFVDEPYLLIKSPELAKQILVKDFNIFMDRTFATPHHDEILKHALFLQKGSDWKLTRTKISPVYTSSKLKNMVPIIKNCTVDLLTYLNEHVGEIEAKEVCCKYTTDVIASTAFGLEANSFKSEDAIFRKVGKAMFQPNLRNSLSQLAYVVAPYWALLFRLDFVERWTTDFMSDVFWKTIKSREEQNTKRNDLIDIIIELRKKEKITKDYNFTGGKAVAQAVQFFTAGFETTASTISFTLYELCINEDIQNRLRSEIIEVLAQHNDDVSFESLQEMKFLDMCIYETLRKYPVLPFLDRRANANYTLPDTQITIPKGTPVLISIMGLHYDETFFPEPDKFIPERMANRSTINSDGIKYLPFGEGPRICIGERLAMITVKTAIIYILRKFEIVKSKNTPVPIEFEPKSFTFGSKVGLPMHLKRLTTK